jgi:hypothetical protein
MRATKFSRSAGAIHFAIYVWILGLRFFTISVEDVKKERMNVAEQCLKMAYWRGVSGTFIYETLQLRRARQHQSPLG